MTNSFLKVVRRVRWAIQVRPDRELIVSTKKYSDEGYLMQVSVVETGFTLDTKMHQKVARVA